MMSMYFEYNTDNPVLQKHEELLRKLAVESRVFCVCNREDNKGFYLIECCDEYYSHNLTKKECLELSELFSEIADLIK